jgi:hypothetical protein
MGDYNIKVRPNIFKLLLILGVVFLAVIYLGILMSSKDPIWFVKGFQDRPYLIVVYDQGKRTEYTAGQPGFDLLANAVVESLDQGIARLSGIGLSKESQQDAYDKYLTLEAFFPQAVKIHSYFDTGRPTQMLFPITGRHSELKVVFFGDGGPYWVNVPALKTLEPIYSALKSLGYQN